MGFDEINPLWSLVDPISVQDAAALVAGFEPNALKVNGDSFWFEDPETGVTDSNGGNWVQTSFKALINAIYAGKLNATIVHDSRPVDESDSQALSDMMECGEYFNPGYEHLTSDDETFIKEFFVKKEPNWNRSMIGLAELKEWLSDRGVKVGFFFPENVQSIDYLDSRNPRYAPKLAAAVKAWQSVTDAGKKSPKQALDKWLREHAAEFGLTNDEGKPIEQAIEECSKVANWKPGGGATKTPT